MPLPKRLARYLSDKVYTTDTAYSKATIIDTRDFTQVIAMGRDLVVNILTLHHKPCTKLGENTLEFPMALDSVKIRVQSFSSEEEPRFMEAVQDAVIAATVNPAETHDEEGFSILRRRMISIHGTTWSRDGEQVEASRLTTMPVLMTALSGAKHKKDTIKKFFRMTKVDTIQPGTGWTVGVGHNNRHTKLVDAICMIFMLSDDNVDIDRNSRFPMGSGIGGDGEYERVSELMPVLNKFGAVLTPTLTSHVLWLMSISMIEIQYSKKHRKFVEDEACTEF